MKNLNKNRCPHKRTSIIAITSALTMIGASGCVHKDVQRADTDSNAPPNIIHEVTTLCPATQLTTTSTKALSTIVQTTTTSTSTTLTRTSSSLTTSTVTTVIPIEVEPVTESETFDSETYTEPIYDIEPCFPITEEERILLCNLVGREYGSDYVPIPEKAKVVAVVMNRVNSPLFPNTIYEVLTQPYQFSGYLASDEYSYQVTDSVIEAVDYYFAHIEEFGDWLYFEGDNVWNYFR